MATAVAQISSHQQMLGCILEIIAIERLVTVTNTLVLMSIRRLCGFESTELMEIGVGEPLEVLFMLKRVGEEISDGSESKVKLPSKTTVTSSEVGECKDAGSDDDDDEDDDDDQEEEIGDEEEEDLSADEGGEDEQNNEEEDQEDEEGGEEANGNDEDDDDEDDEEGEGDDDEEDDDDEDDEDDEEDEEPPTKKKK